MKQETTTNRKEEKMKTRLHNYEIVRQIDTDSIRWSALVGQSAQTGYPVSGTLNTKTNIAHLDSNCQTLQDDQFEHFNIEEAVEARY